MDDTTDNSTVAPREQTDVYQELRTALSTARDLGPDYDEELARAIAERVTASPAKPGAAREPQGASRRDRVRRTATAAATREPQGASRRGRGQRTVTAALTATLIVIATAWFTAAAPEAPASAAWGIVGVLALAAHVVRTWWSPGRGEDYS